MDMTPEDFLFFSFFLSFFCFDIGISFFLRVYSIKKTQKNEEGKKKELYGSTSICGVLKIIDVVFFFFLGWKNIWFYNSDEKLQQVGLTFVNILIYNMLILTTNKPERKKITNEESHTLFCLDPVMTLMITIKKG